MAVKDTAAKTKPLISKENAQNRPETIQWETVLGISAFREQIGSEKEVLAMPRMPKYLKEEWAFFLDERGRKKYNELCRKCERSCKQSFRAAVIQCPHYLSKRRTRQ
ncbi:hypothetical protein DWY31_04875 [Dorea sp. AF24-7LB]|nr:hypothetical protein DWY31_04875 [Dorea sp. AF24-7LB]